jgi:hypothetical protein
MFRTAEVSASQIARMSNASRSSTICASVPRITCAAAASQYV